MLSVNIQFKNVSFSYSAASENIVSMLSLHFGKGWTGICGPNGSGKTTIAKLSTGILVPSKGFISGLESISSAIYCAQETEYPPENSEEFLFSKSNRAGELRSLLCIRNDWIDRWDTLSHGERKRFQTGAALWQDPDVLALDEPTNHLDYSAKRLICEALKTWHGTGLLISHDRDLLDLLCTSTLFVRPGSIIMRPGGVSAGLEQESLEEKSRAREYELASENLRRVKKSLNSLKQKENSRQGSLSKKNINKRDHDNKSRIDLARLSGKDKSGSRKIKIMENRIEGLKRNKSLKYFKQRRVDGITYSSEKFSGDRIVLIPEGKIQTGSAGYIEIPEIPILSSDRIGITGDNGTGKSTLIRYIRSLLKLPDSKVIYISQEISSGEWLDYETEIKNFSGRDFGELLSAVFRLGSEPERILQTSSPSPGEIRKFIIAMGLLKKPALIMMDEPTNHMDMPSVECLEDALSKFDGAIIIISHDRRFIQNVTDIEWNLTKKNGRSTLTIIK